MCAKNQVIISCIGLAVIAALIGQIEATEYPTPPPVPSQFLTPNDVQKYLNQLHNYYMVVGRPRFGKRSRVRAADYSDADDEPYIGSMFSFLDLNGDSAISLAEFKRIFDKESIAE
ncbi:neuropeptide Y [Brachionus plicatilis]|uniref:Neuropeptide Y n=1 Tax=Brachionus plicatilis TaxID=10195 RepID=A0A3M7P6X2_BRAPC|nr:neuropeptide Y [Brachionus plicatilis]